MNDELKAKLREILLTNINVVLDWGTDDAQEVDRLINQIDQAYQPIIATAIAEAEKAYGGCRKCYGKGYATVNDRWAGTDEWTGERFTGGNPNAMKFCTCERGKQLEKLLSPTTPDRGEDE